MVQLVLILALLGIPASVALAQDPAPPAETLEKAFPSREHYSPYAGRNFPTNVYWGDTHLHTGLSSRSVWLRRQSIDVG